MYRCILVPVDGTEFGERVLGLAATIAHRAGAALHLTHVHLPTVAPIGMYAVSTAWPWSEALKEQETAHLEGLAQRLAVAFRVRVTFRVIDGPVPDALGRSALDCGADLVVMSAHGHAGVGRVWHRCVAEQVVQKLPIPVMLVHAAAEESRPHLSGAKEIRHVLIPLDGSAHPYPLLERAIALGRGFRARYTLLRVVRPLARSGRPGDGNEIGWRALEHDQTAAHHYLTGFAERMRAGGLDVRTEVRVGEDAPAAITAFVRDSARAGSPVELVAMERHPHHGFAEALATHATDVVVRDAGVPVLLVRSSAPINSPAQVAAVAVRV